MNHSVPPCPIQNHVPEVENIVKHEFQTTEELDSWISSESSAIEWRKRDDKIGTKKTEVALEAGQPRLNGLVFTDVHSMVKNRVNTKDSMKVGCQASIKVRKEFDDNRIVVTYNNQHTGHKVNSDEDRKKQRLPLVLGTWLQEVVASGADWTAVKNLIHPKEGVEKKLDKLRFEGAESQINLEKEPVERPHMLRITYHDYYNARQKHNKNVTQLHPKV